MKKLQSSLTNMVIVLTVVTVIAGTILAFVNEKTKTTIENRAQVALANGIKTVMGDDQLKVVATDTIGTKYIVFTTQNSQGEYLGVAVQSEEIGFGGPLKILVGFNAQDAITGYTVLNHAETPGLGSKAGEWFQADGKGNIIGKVPSTPLVVSKDEKGLNSVDAITASTITSRAFLKAVNSAYEAYKELKSADENASSSSSINPVKAEEQQSADNDKSEKE